MTFPAKGMADIVTLKRIYLLLAKRVAPNDVNFQISTLEGWLLDNGSPGQQLLSGGQMITSASQDGRSHSIITSATPDDRATALLQAIDELKGAPTAPGGCLMLDFRTFRP